jgi:hypothetical protein
VSDLRRARALAFQPMEGGAGARRYWRVRFERLPSSVLMHARPEDLRIRPPALRRPTPDLPFLTMSDLLERHGIPVPNREGVHPSRTWVLLEDLGDRRLCDEPAASQQVQRVHAIEWLARTHAIPERSALLLERCFDADWIRFELALFVEELAPEAREGTRGALEEVIAAIEALPLVLCLRDYQSQNLMIDAAGRLRILDYQDALLAPAELDLAAFLFDSYVEIDSEERRQLLERYASFRGQAVEPGSFALLVVQRKCKDWSRFRSLVHGGDLRFAPYQERARLAARQACDALAGDLFGAGRILARALDRAGT